MPVTLTLENVPDEVYTRLESAAKAHHRSVTGEALACLEQATMPIRLSVEERLERVQKLRESLPNGGIPSEEILKIIREDRDRR
jgi:antitoxin FitA